MKNRISVFSIFCVVFFFIFAAFMAWYLPSMSSVRSKTVQTQRDLETSRGREDRQQAEYDKAVSELPLVKAELEEKQPLAEEALKTIEDLKEVLKIENVDDDPKLADTLYRIKSVIRLIFDTSTDFKLYFFLGAIIDLNSFLLFKFSFPLIE